MKALRKYSSTIKPLAARQAVPVAQRRLPLQHDPQADLRSLHRKTDNRVYDGGRLRKRPVYRIPLLKDYEEA